LSLIDGCGWTRRRRTQQILSGIGMTRWLLVSNLISG
jgi:hypothetical protein